MIYTETSRLILREPTRDDLPRLVELIGDWEVARWLVSVPYPYHLQNAEDFLARMQAALRLGAPEYFLIQRKNDERQIGAVGLHPSREPSPQTGELVIGYWLGQDYWNHGYMSEAITPVLDLAFLRPDVDLLTSTTDPANEASQKVLRKAGFAYLGTSPSRDQQALRGSPDVTRWQMTRKDYETRR